MALTRLKKALVLLEYGYATDLLDAYAQLEENEFVGLFEEDG